MMTKEKLGNLCDVLNGYAFKSSKYVKDGIRVIRITNVQKGIIEDSDPKYYPIDEKENLKNYLLCENDLLISLTGNVGRVGLLGRELLPSALNQRVGCLRIKDKNKISMRYLFQALNSNRFELECINSSKGIAQKNLSTEWLKEYEISIPSMEEQNTIAQKLENVQSIIDMRKKQLEDLNNLIKSQFVEMFGDPEKNEKNWGVGLIRDLISDIKYGTSRPAGENGRHKYLRMNNITYEGKLDLTDIKYIDVPENEIEKCVAKKGDILFNRTNSRDLVGKTCVYNNDESMIIAGFVIRARVNKKANPYFISEYMNTKYMKNKLKSMCKNACGQSNINSNEFQNIRIYIPPIELQNKFASFVEHIDKLEFELKKSLEETQNLFDSLMAEYFE